MMEETKQNDDDLQRQREVKEKKGKREEARQKRFTAGVPTEQDVENCNDLRELRRQISILRQRVSRFERIEAKEKEKQRDGGFFIEMKAIGLFESCYKQKHGAPRQGRLCETARGRVVVKTDGGGGGDALQGLNDFSHVWLFYVFHMNLCVAVRNKIRLPKLDGGKLGTFATRSPHRPNPIGICCCKIEKIEGNSLYVSGMDLVDGTPILDIKPYVTPYDSYPDAKVPPFILTTQVPEEDRIQSVHFTPEAEEQLKTLVEGGCLDLYSTSELDLVRTTVKRVLELDPRSINQREKTKRDGVYLYATYFDRLNIHYKVLDSDHSITIYSIELFDPRETPSPTVATIFDSPSSGETSSTSPSTGTPTETASFTTILPVTQRMPRKHRRKYFEQEKKKAAAAAAAAAATATAATATAATATGSTGTVAGATTATTAGVVAGAADETSSSGSSLDVPIPSS